MREPTTQTPGPPTLKWRNAALSPTKAKRPENPSRKENAHRFTTESRIRRRHTEPPEPLDLQDGALVTLYIDGQSDNTGQQHNAPEIAAKYAGRGQWTHSTTRQPTGHRTTGTTCTNTPRRSTDAGSVHCADRTLQPCSQLMHTPLRLKPQTATGQPKREMT